MKTLLLILFCLACGAFADERIRPTSKDQMGASTSKMVKVVGAKASFVNFEAIRRDFPAVRGMSNGDIEKWVLENFAYISEEQAKLNGIRNSDIPLNPEQTKDGYRPEGYIRSAVMDAQVGGKSVGLVDMKGVGHPPGFATSQVKDFEAAKGDPEKIDAIRKRDHSDGLMRHGEAVAELTRQMALQRLYDLHNHAHGTDYQTVETYFLIELPFDVLGPHGQLDRAALYGRQAHWRGRSGVEIPDAIYRDPHGGKQGTIFRSTVDFGGVLLDMHPELKEHFGVKTGGRENDPQDSLPWAWGHDTAKAFARGDERAVYNHLADLLRPLDEAWHKLPTNREIGKGRQKEFLDLVEKARKAHTRVQVVKVFEHAEELDIPLMAAAIDALSPEALRMAMSEPRILKHKALRAVMSYLLPASMSATDPQWRKWADAFAGASQNPEIPFADREEALRGLGRVGVRLAKNVQSRVLQPYRDAFVAKAMETLETTRGHNDRLRILIAVAETGQRPPGFYDAAAEVLIRESDSSDRWGFVRGANLIDALFASGVPEDIAIWSDVFADSTYSTRMRIGRYFAALKPPPANASAMLIQNMYSMDQRISSGLLESLVALNQPEGRAWVLQGLAKDRLQTNVQDLWWAAKGLKFSPEELAPTIIAVLDRGNPTDDHKIGAEMSQYLLDSKHPAAEAAVKGWLRGVGGEMRGVLCALPTTDARVRQAAREMGVGSTCRDAFRTAYHTARQNLRYVNKKGLVWGGVAIGGLIAGISQLPPIPVEVKECHDRRGQWNSSLKACVCADGEPIGEGTCEERNRAHYSRKRAKQ